MSQELRDRGMGLCSEKPEVWIKEGPRYTSRLFLSKDRDGLWHSSRGAHLDSIGSPDWISPAYESPITALISAELCDWGRS